VFSFASRLQNTTDSHNLGIVIFDTVLDQVQAYDNLVPVVVEALRFMTPLSLDILSYVIVEHLSAPNKERLKEDGTNIASWLANLAVFCGALYTRYYDMELTGILQYVTNQLKVRVFLLVGVVCHGIMVMCRVCVGVVW